MLMTSTQTDSIYSTSSVTTKDRIKEQRQETMDKVNTVTGYYREHPENFVEDYLNIILKPFQSILICFMNICNQFMFLACRGLGKTFLVAIFALLDVFYIREQQYVLHLVTENRLIWFWTRL